MKDDSDWKSLGVLSHAHRVALEAQTKAEGSSVEMRVLKNGEVQVRTSRAHLAHVEEVRAERIAQQDEQIKAEQAASDAGFVAMRKRQRERRVEEAARNKRLHDAYIGERRGHDLSQDDEDAIRAMLANVSDEKDPKKAKALVEAAQKELKKRSIDRADAQE